MADRREFSEFVINMMRSCQSFVPVIEAATRVNNQVMTDELRERAQRVEDMAKKEVAAGFQMVYRDDVLSIWHSLDNHIRRLAVAWITEHPDALRTQAVQKLRIRLGDLFEMSNDDRMHYIVDQLDQEMSGPLKLGVTRFETLLEPFGLSGSVDELIRRTIFELQQVRNVIVHRGARADRQLIERCPWLGLKNGETLVINKNMSIRFHLGGILYVGVVGDRVLRKFEEDGDSYLIQGFSEQHRDLQKLHSQAFPDSTPAPIAPG